MNSRTQNPQQRNAKFSRGNIPVDSGTLQSKSPRTSKSKFKVYKAAQIKPPPWTIVLQANVSDIDDDAQPQEKRDQD